MHDELVAVLRQALADRMMRQDEITSPPLRNYVYIPNGDPEDDLTALATHLAEVVGRTWGFMEAQEAFRERDVARRELVELRQEVRECLLLRDEEIHAWSGGLPASINPAIARALQKVELS